MKIKQLRCCRSAQVALHEGHRCTRSENKAIRRVAANDILREDPKREERIMTIKGQLARLKRHLAKSGQGVISFVIPYCRDAKAQDNLKHSLLLKHNLTNFRDRIVVFVIDYATASTTCAF